VSTDCDNRDPGRRLEAASPVGGRPLAFGDRPTFALTDDSTNDTVAHAVEPRPNGRPRLSIVPSPALDAAAPRESAGTAGTAESAAHTRGGLAVIGPARLLRSSLSGKESTDLGLLTHTLVSTHAPLVADGLPADVLARMTALARGLLDANPNRRRVVAAEAVGLAYRYLSDLAPRAPWLLLGVEFETGSGPVDVAWVHGDSGHVLFDELKTTRAASGKVPDKWREQVFRYAAAGRLEYGSDFAGVRLLPLNAMRLARLTRSAQRWVSVAPTAPEPFRLKGAR
jgi:hypothetical protein